MEEGPVELIVRAGGCRGLGGKRGAVSWEAPYGPRDLHVPASYRPPMGGRGGHFSGPVGVWCRDPGPVQRRHRTAERCSLSRGARQGESASKTRRVPSVLSRRAVQGESDVDRGHTESPNDPVDSLFAPLFESILDAPKPRCRLVSSVCRWTLITAMV
jgi:hypothetical protein